MKNFSILSKHRKLAVFMATLWLLAAMLTGCGNLSGNKTAPPDATRMVTDAKGNPVRLPLKPKRIVSLMLDTDELIMDLVTPDRIAGLSHLSDDPGISHITDRSGQIKNKLKGNNAEQILALKPDLVLIADWWSPAVLQTLRDMGIAVYAFKTPYRVNDVKETVKEVAEAVGEKEKGEAINQAYEKKIKAVQARLAKFTAGPARKVITIAGMGAFGIKGSLYDDMCNYVHINNCQRDLKIDKNAMLPKELIVQADPDIILIPSWDAPGMQKKQSIEELLQDPCLKTVTAVKENRIRKVSGRCLYAINHNAAESMELLAKAVYPEAFK